MCGIAGYIGGWDAPKTLFDMLHKLEYRGYDSAGIAFLTEKGIKVLKDEGNVEDVRREVKPEKLKSKIGVAHTRWATHGIPSQVNAHPHTDCSGRFVVAHNGIIENHLELQQELAERGHKFKSQTDTEVVSHLIEEYYNGDFLTAFKNALKRLRGSYALCALSTIEPDRILVARKESPLIIGLGVGENFIGSDVPAFLSKTKKVIILEDFEYGVVSKDGVEIRDLKTGRVVEKKVEDVEWDVGEAQKGGFHHFMLKEIHDEPEAAKNALRSRGVLESIAKKISKKKRVYFVACGTAYHVALIGKYLLESWGIQAEAVIASEFRYSTVKTLDESCAVVAISQSGETADTLAAVKGAKDRGVYLACIVNVAGSSLTRVSDDVAYIYAGPEIAVASTKTYIGQVVCVTMLAPYLAREVGKASEREVSTLLRELNEVPAKIQKILDENNIKQISEKYSKTKTFFYIGRRQNFPTAFEGALKLKEVSYVHAEGYPAGELKHGPLALMEEGVVVLAILSGDELKEKIAANVSEVTARGATVLSVGEAGDLRIPKAHPLISPVLNIVPLHLFAYYISVLKGLDPDKPRNLAKSVTVE